MDNKTTTNNTIVDKDRIVDSIMKKLDLLIKSAELAAAAEESDDVD